MDKLSQTNILILLVPFLGALIGIIFWFARKLVTDFGLIQCRNEKADAVLQEQVSALALIVHEVKEDVAHLKGVLGK